MTSGISIRNYLPQLRDTINRKLSLALGRAARPGLPLTLKDSEIQGHHKSRAPAILWVPDSPLGFRCSYRILLLYDRRWIPLADQNLLLRRIQAHG